jgi:hypothetical protein
MEGFEFDITVPSARLAIEYDGLYWHSSNAGYPKDRHLKKTDALERLGWTVIHIFEDEWLHKRQVVENRLRHLIGASSARIGARECEVRAITASTSKQFLEAHHIQGSVPAKHHLGLFHGSRLVAVATLGRARFRKDCVWELLRFATVAGTSVPGAIGKLISAFRHQHAGAIVSYADRRWGLGRTYSSIGFEQIGVSPPSYFYFKGDLRHSRMTFQKAKLKDLPTFSESKTEEQIMLEDGWNRIYDCGTRVFRLP